jgi:hypothetical protein
MKHHFPCRLSSLLGAAVLLLGGIPVYADSSGTPPEGSPAVTETETDTEISMDSANPSYEGSARVSFKGGSTFTVKIPKSITVGSTRNADYSITVSGDIASGEAVIVEPENAVEDSTDGTTAFYMEDISTESRNKSAVVAEVTPAKTVWSCQDVSDAVTEKKNHISAPDLSSGTWEGTLCFSISLHTHAYVDGVCSCGMTSMQAQSAGLFDRDGKSIMDWEALAAAGLDPAVDHVSMQDSGTLYSILYDADGSLKAEYADISVLVLPEDTTVIGAYAFAGCTVLTRVEVPKGVTSIGACAFGGVPEISYGGTLASEDSWGAGKIVPQKTAEETTADE